MKFTVKIHEITFSLSCHEALKAQANWVLELMRTIGLERGPGFFRNGTTTQVGWTILTTLEKENEFVICEPKYSGNPFKELFDDLTCSLSVQAQQNDFVTELGVQPVPAIFRQKVIYSDGCLDVPRIYLQRQQVKPNDSGWYIGPVDSALKTGSYAACYVYDLLRLRPEVMPVLQLPEGYLVDFAGDRLDGILDPNDKRVR